MRRAMPRLIWSSETVLCCRVQLLRLRHRNLSLARSRVGLMITHHLCDWGAGIDMACRLCTHYIDDLVPYYSPSELCSYWGCGKVFNIMCCWCARTQMRTAKLRKNLIGKKKVKCIARFEPTLFCSTHKSPSSPLPPLSLLPVVTLPIL